jgi:hypothetical protein
MRFALEGPPTTLYSQRFSLTKRHPVKHNERTTVALMSSDVRFRIILHYINTFDYASISNPGRAFQAAQLVGG